MTHQPYSSRLERAYDRFDAWHRARVDRQVERRHRRIDEKHRAMISGHRKAGPGVFVILASYGFSLLAATGLATGLDHAFGLGNGPVGAIAMVGGITLWMVLLLVLVVRKIHRQSAAAAAGLKE